MVNATVPIIVALDVPTAEEAVRLADQLAVAGDAVLLSPACASFDMFENYRQRGEHFIRAVQELGR